MSAIQYQNNNLLENFYTDGVLNYVLTSTISQYPDYFQFIYSYTKNYISTWVPLQNNKKNRIVFNSGTMFEIIFYETIIIVIPLYISNYSNYENDLSKIIQWCNTFIILEYKITKLIQLLNPKIIIYSLTNNLRNVKFNLFTTNKNILDAPLYTSMYEGQPIQLPLTSNLINDINGNINYLPYTLTNNFNSGFDKLKKEQKIENMIVI